MIKFIQQRIASFKWAIKGLKDLFSNHPNAQVHLLATVLVIPIAFFLQITLIEWALIILCIALVTAMEAMNSALEYLADKISPEHDELIGKSKDIAAGAVLLSAIGAALVGALILGPKLYALF
ncbi:MULTISPECIES: diacylglycerol kinase [unclassified Aureispira]|uniref:diacylglycerol kinase n=1 Tax=unclassified Aureispira TaxID=2649989 RepID=UPI000698FD17|nr:MULTISPECIES: diacylglycerol kinase family protein [unclassified Aureispira]WMX14662.1 diacylglycerol kinase family protein [Aureispira sp. CCB-E]